MGLFNFFKKKPKQEQKEQETKIKFQNIEQYIKNKEDDFKPQEKQVLESVEEKIKNFIKELKEKINILQDVNVDSKKAEDRIKSITEEGRKRYIENLENLIKKLDNLEHSTFEEISNKVNQFFLDFDKGSKMNYEKATFLVGKEMVSIKDNLKSFSRDLIKLFNENKNLVESFKKIGLIRLKLNQIKKIEKFIEKSKTSKISVNQKLNSIKEDEKKVLFNIEEYKKTNEYQNILKAKEKIKEFEKNLEPSLIKLKSLIDFKALSNFFHKYEKDMEIVKKYKESFQENFEKDFGESILKLLIESKLNKKEIEGKIEEINKKIKDLDGHKEIIKKDKTKEFLDNLEKIRIELEDLETEYSKELKIHERLIFSKERLVESVKKTVQSFGVEFED